MDAATTVVARHCFSRIQHLCARFQDAGRVHSPNVTHFQRPMFHLVLHLVAPVCDRYAGGHTVTVGPTLVCVSAAQVLAWQCFDYLGFGAMCRCCGWISTPLLMFPVTVDAGTSLVLCSMVHRLNAGHGQHTQFQPAPTPLPCQYPPPSDAQLSVPHKVSYIITHRYLT